ncbi:MAG: ATP-binding protein [candidate division KSB1 bacterium]|nr:ATP-binding protein [candidate division KSB1 bacterium]MDZ7368881.1 ATP-binding protein [candidate division KSB1 bacterium]MDZ7406869.1 ATP-binding protein [candidate division KSB1 bacterium]
MVYKNFRLNCILRAALLGATIYLFCHLLLQTTLYATIVIVGSIIFYQIYSLIHYVEKTNRDLTRFLEAIKHTDFSQTFSTTGLGSSFEPLKKAFNEVIEEFRRARAEKEEHFRYLQTVVQHIGIGLIAFGRDGEVSLINTAAKRLLGVTHLKNIKTLETLSQPLVATLLQLESGGKALVKIEAKNELLHLAIYATEFKLREQIFTLVSLQNIQSELEEKEMEAWQNLIRVLTHEIMNSVTPIASLASTVNDWLDAKKPARDEISADEIGDMRGAVQTIQKRSAGLLHFVDAYRSLTRIPRPNLKIFRITELFAGVEQLLRASFKEKTVNLNIEVEPESLELTADPEMIEQVLINLLLNAIQAVEGLPNAAISLIARLDDGGRVIIQVADNGPGIVPEVLDKIFIPFFTTKPGGSGIGLSLSRQIMRLHRGAITARSEPNVETVFTLRF